MVAAAVGIGTAAAGAYGASQNASAANAGKDESTILGLYGGMINQQNMLNIQKWLAPYTDAGLSAVSSARDLLGLNGAAGQQAAVSGIESSPQFLAMLKQGENSILQNASATGGLRGGNTQAALAKFSPSLLAASINDRLAQLSGVATLGANTGLGVGSQAQQAGSSNSSLINGMMQANSANTAAQISANNGLTNSISSGLGLWAGMQKPAVAGSGNSNWVSGSGNYSGYVQPDYGAYF